MWAPCESCTAASCCYSINGCWVKNDGGSPIPLNLTLKWTDGDGMYTTRDGNWWVVIVRTADERPRWVWYVNQGGYPSEGSLLVSPWPIETVKKIAESELRREQRLKEEILK